MILMHIWEAFKSGISKNSSKAKKGFNSIRRMENNGVNYSFLRRGVKRYMMHSHGSEICLSSQ